jgi:hypothetical protein
MRSSRPSDQTQQGQGNTPSLAGCNSSRPFESAEKGIIEEGGGKWVEIRFRIHPTKCTYPSMRKGRDPLFLGSKSVTDDSTHSFLLCSQPVSCQFLFDLGAEGWPDI